MMIPKELRSWINDGLDKGHSVEELKEKLVKSRYEPAYVDSVFEEMKVLEKVGKEPEIHLPEKPSSHSKKYWLIMVFVLIMLVLGVALIYLGIREFV